MKMIGRIHSVETCGTVDGPGLRYVVFMQGCPMRCRYCHNPDTWDVKAGKEITADSLMEEIERYLPYMRASGGGVTATGGEPMLQTPFVSELFSRCKEKGIHTALDTSGICYRPEKKQDPDLERLLSVTDLVLLDLKVIDAAKHHWLTGHHNKGILAFAKLLSRRNIPMWIRHVLVPGVTDDPEEIGRLAQFLAQLASVEKVEVLPYHKLGVYKWEALGIPYSLKDTVPPDQDEVEKISKLLNESLRSSVPFH